MTRLLLSELRLWWRQFWCEHPVWRVVNSNSGSKCRECGKEWRQ